MNGQRNATEGLSAILRRTRTRSLRGAATLSFAWLVASFATGAQAQDSARTDDSGPHVLEIEGTTYELPVLHPLGVRPDSRERVAAKRLAPAPASDVILVPVIVDFSAELPGPGNQGSQGSCVGWAVGYGAKSFHEVVEEGWSPDSSQHQFSPSWIYNQINGGVDNGSSIGDAMSLLVAQGADTLHDFGYDDDNYTRQPDADSYQRAWHYRAASWNTLNVTVPDLKAQLADGNVIVIGFAVLPDFDALNGSSNKVYDTAAGTRGDCHTAPCVRGYHAVAIVGYDDDVQAFRFINSWGDDYGDDGYGWIAYSFITDPDLDLSAYVLNDGPNDPFLVQPVFPADMAARWFEATGALR
jgi:hypothetical protein